jgi:hypothetical protein
MIPRILALASLLLIRPLAAQRPELTIAWDPAAIAQVRSLFGITRTEFSGCLYGQAVGDTILVNFFIPGASDPRTASDSGVRAGSCPNIQTTKGNRLVGVFHTHMRPFSLCVPSGFGPDSTPPRKDRAVLIAWALLGARFGAIMCAGGDSLATYTLSAYGIMGVPPLDSLYPEHP